MGARPQFIKLKPIADVIQSKKLEHVVVHTGQHYDANMSDVFFQELDTAPPDVNLGVGSGSHASQTAEMLVGLEATFLSEKPDWVLVYGDTNSTLAAAVAASKLNLRIGHVESGLRSNNREMPEEINRIITDHVSSLLFAPTKLAMKNLDQEGLSSRSILSGDVMADVLLKSSDAINRTKLRNVPESLTSGEFIVATVHRASNTDKHENLVQILDSLSQLGTDVVLVAHPRLRAAMSSQGLNLPSGSLHIVEPLGYFEMLKLVKSSIGVITDSGGLQKDAFLLGVPCITLRSESEWPETFMSSMNILAPEAGNLNELLRRQVGVVSENPFGDGTAAEKIVQALLDR